MSIELKIVIIEFFIIILTNSMWLLGYKLISETWTKKYIEMDNEWREVCRELNSEYLRKNLDE